MRNLLGIFLGACLAVSGCGDDDGGATDAGPGTDSGPQIDSGGGGVDGGGGNVDGGGGDVDGGGGGGLPALAEADKPAVTPCPNQAILSDGTMLEALKTAMLSGAVAHRDIAYDGTDPDNLHRKCGFEGNFDPEDGTISLVPAGGDGVHPDVAALIMSGNSGICADGFGHSSFGSGEGFPAAGVYRKEFVASYMATMTTVRTRITVSGTAAGLPFNDASLMIDISTADDLEALTYVLDGTVVAHGDLWQAITDSLAPDTQSMRLEVKKEAAGAVILTADIEFICAAPTT